MKKTISIILILSLILCVFTSCGTDEDTADPDVILSSILKSYKTGGLTLWWEVVAIYNAGENPTDYKGFEDLYKSLEGTTNLKMASYVIVANTAVIRGADKNDFDKYEEYKSSLKNLLENPTDEYTLNDYIFGYLALKTSGTIFGELPCFGYLSQVQKSDGGFALSGNSGDADMTAFTLQAMNLIYSHNRSTGAYITSPLHNAVDFLKNQINENGTFSSYGNENANSTASAISALISENNSENNEIIQKASDALALFKVKKNAGYSYLIDGRADTLATAQAAIALGDLKNKTSVWEKLYLDSAAALDEAQ